VKRVILFGELAPTLARQLMALSHSPELHLTQVKTLAEAVAEAARMAEPGDVVLFSPGGASFDAFTDFAERGEVFKQLVNHLP
jgi:UDP-N-acetylmuramoylalanine--D-glutamate ligase